ncbi:chemotaxis protein [Oceanimonas sp. CHS3-5]|uniref:chemotaxis protein n=1 Tax=Oceanimonas sp. CHS3-5 TaxID=3068186 RepID=UPI00273E9514|nr:chemotaxis protein [Oceanimonas sp. CHS3-5]MDP5293106.1 chemotaxis protein [Oceanimonas sp. CHS3-5]
MHHRVFLRLAFTLAPVLLLAGAIALVMLLQSQRALTLAQQTRFEYFEAANQIRQLSGQLSAGIRNYAYTGSERSLSLYRHVLAMTEGRHPRDNGRVISNEQLLRSMTLTREELNLLERARQATLTLARLEDEALRLMEAGHYAQARQKVFNPDYDSYREVVTGSVNQFVNLLVARLERNIEQARQQNRYTMIAMLITFLLLVLCSLVLGWQLRQGQRHQGRVVLAARHGTPG